MCDAKNKIKTGFIWVGTKTKSYLHLLGMLPNHFLYINLHDCIPNKQLKISVTIKILLNARTFIQNSTFTIEEDERLLEATL